MATYIETNVRYEKIAENGSKVQKVNEPYLVDALTVSEAEARVTEEVRPFISGEFLVSATKQINIAEIFRGPGDWWYKVKANFITINETTGVEKRTAFCYLVQATDFKCAYDRFVEGMKGTTIDYEIFSIAETKIMDVFDAK